MAPTEAGFAALPAIGRRDRDRRPLMSESRCRAVRHPLGHRRAGPDRRVVGRRLRACARRRADRGRVAVLGAGRGLRRSPRRGPGLRFLLRADGRSRGRRHLHRHAAPAAPRRRRGRAASRQRRSGREVVHRDRRRRAGHRHARPTPPAVSPWRRCGPGSNRPSSGCGSCWPTARSAPCCPYRPISAWSRPSTRRTACSTRPSAAARCSISACTWCRSRRWSWVRPNGSPPPARSARPAWRSTRPSCSASRAAPPPR